jgi:hypothetical protein
MGEADISLEVRKVAEEPVFIPLAVGNIAVEPPQQLSKENWISLGQKPAVL